MLKQSKMKQKVHKITTGFVLCWQLFLERGTALACSWSTRWDSAGENRFSLCQQVSTTDNFLVKGKTLCLLIPLSSGAPCGWHLRGLCSCCNTLSSHAHQPCCVCTTLLAWSHPSRWLLESLLAPLPYRLLSLGGRGLIKASHLCLSLPTSLTLCSLSLR